MRDSAVFLRPRLVGLRFEGHAIPLEFLKDLAGLEEMVLEVAKWKYIQDNPGRQRVPRRFSEGMELALAAVESGSAVPVVVFSAPAVPPQHHLYAEKARDAIIQAIDSMEKGTFSEGILPEKALGYFDRIGRSLREGESIEFLTPGRPEGARLSRDVRRRLLLASQSVREWTEEISVRGTIPEVDQHEMSFQIQLPDGRKLRAPMPVEHADTVLSVFNAYREGVHLLLHGTGRFSRQNTLLSFDSIQRLTPLDPLDVGVRIDELLLMKNGWLDGEGLAPDPSGLRWFAAAFDASFPDDLPLPCLFPTPEGGIQAEWSLEGHEIEMEIDLKTRTGELLILNPQENEEETNHSVNLSSPEGWKLLAEEIRRIAGVTQSTTRHL
jgi:hypothetical protein